VRDLKNSNLGLVTGLATGAALGGLLFGYDTAVISGAVTAIDHNFVAPRTDLSELQRNALSGSAVGIALWGCVLGSLIAGLLSTSIGRRGGMLVAAAIFFVSSILSGFPETGLAPLGGLGAEALTPFMVYRFLGGVAIGMASLISPMYIAEISPAKFRGLFVTFQQIAIVVGIDLVYFVNLQIARWGHGNDIWLLSLGWRYMLASCAIPAALFFGAGLLMSDTPRWYAMKGRAEKAKTLLKALNEPEDADQIYSEIEESLTAHSGKVLSFGWPILFVGIGLSVFQQFVGINAVLYYAPLMFKHIGSGTDTAFLQTVIMGAANVAFTLVATVTVDRWGRKPLLIIGAIVMALSMFVLGMLFQTHQEGTYLLIAAIAYTAGFALSWGPIVWVVISEIFPNSIKGSAMSIAVSAQWISNFLVTWSFKVVDGDSSLNAMFNHGFAYYFYSAFAVLAAIFVWRFVPETKGKSLEAIERLWRAGQR
jgi:SP family xylose:H+ symportor-like MFS transporter